MRFSFFSSSTNDILAKSLLVQEYVMNMILNDCSLFFLFLWQPLDQKQLYLLLERFLKKNLVNAPAADNSPSHKM
jgi:hypothetical protein